MGSRKYHQVGSDNTTMMWLQCLESLIKRCSTSSWSSTDVENRCKRVWSDLGLVRLCIKVVLNVLFNDRRCINSSMMILTRNVMNVHDHNSYFSRLRRV